MKNLILTLFICLPLLSIGQIGSYGIGFRGLSIQSQFKPGFGYTARTFFVGGYGSGNLLLHNKTEFNGIYRYNFNQRFGIYGGFGFRSILNLSFSDVSNQTSIESHYQMPIGFEVFPLKNRPMVSLSFEGIFCPRYYGMFDIGRLGLSPNIQLNIYLNPKTSNKASTKNF